MKLFKKPSGNSVGDDAPTPRKRPASSLPPSIKKSRGLKQIVIAGESMEGQPLPSDDDTKWTAKQKYVFDKAIKDCPPELQEEWRSAMASGDKDRQRKLVNSL
eukprot:12095228-Alexandrium_andersonii.AAC.1